MPCSARHTHNATDVSNRVETRNQCQAQQSSHLQCLANRHSLDEKAIHLLSKLAALVGDESVPLTTISPHTPQSPATALSFWVVIPKVQDSETASQGSLQESPHICPQPIPPAAQPWRREWRPRRQRWHPEHRQRRPAKHGTLAGCSRRFSSKHSTDPNMETV